MQKPEDKKTAKASDTSMSDILCDALATYPYVSRVAIASDFDNPDMCSSLVSFMSLFAGRDSNNSEKE